MHVQNPTLAVIGFPGNNCEIETVRAAERNGFTAEWIRWNEIDRIGHFDAYVLPGGFSFEDRGRAGALAAREPIFEALRAEARAGKVILGICNGAQMVVESGLIPVGDQALPFALADNIRRDATGHVVGTGYYTAWNNLRVVNSHTAFTNQVQGLIQVPIAHGEGRFTSENVVGQAALAGDAQVAFRYCDANGKIDTHYPVTPNGATDAVAMIVNTEGTIGALMPHPERFYDHFSGDQIWQSMRAWVVDKKSPDTVVIGDLSGQAEPNIETLELVPGGLTFSKSLIITDNEAFSVQSTARAIAGDQVELHKSWIYHITGEGLDAADLKATGLIHNANKEHLTVFEPSDSQLLVEPLVNDEADHLADQLSEALGKPVQVRLFKAWDFAATPADAKIAILKNGLLANPNAHKIFQP